MIIGLLIDKKSHKLFIVLLFIAGLHMSQVQGGSASLPYLDWISQRFSTPPAAPTIPVSTPPTPQITPPLQTPPPLQQQIASGEAAGQTPQSNPAGTGQTPPSQGNAARAAGANAGAGGTGVSTANNESYLNNVIQSGSDLMNRAYGSIYSNLPTRMQATALGVGTMVSAYGLQRYRLNSMYNKIHARYAPFIILFLYADNPGARRTLHQNPNNVDAFWRLVATDNSLPTGLTTLDSKYQGYSFVGFVENLTRSINSLSGSWVLWGTDLYDKLKVLAGILKHIKQFAMGTTTYQSQNDAFIRSEREQILQKLQAELTECQRQLEAERRIPKLSL